MKEDIFEERQEVATKPLNDCHLLDHFAKIVELSKDSQLSDDFFETAAEHIDILTELFDLTPTQVAIWAVIINSNYSNTVGVEALARHFKCLPINIMQRMSEINQLMDKGYIVGNNDFRMSFGVPHEVIDSLYNNEIYSKRDVKCATIHDFFNLINLWVEECEARRISQVGLEEKINQIFTKNTHLNFVNRLEELKLTTTNELLFCYLCSMFINDENEELYIRELSSSIYGRNITSIRLSLVNGTNELFKKNLIEFSDKEDLRVRDCYKLTSFAKKEVLAELELNITDEIKTESGITLHDSIIEKELFYNELESKEIKRLANLLDQRNFDDVRQRLWDNGMRKGFACLFYGMHGTGKTETAFQLAKQSGRHILPIDVTQIKSKWVGESEQNIKAIFTKYKRYVDEFDVAPILLFNEADGVFGIRQEGATRSVDKMANSIQNIILEEMEKLDGILIATTNLTQNFDKAFERRFIYKIQFTKPCLEAKQSIWKVMMPELSDDDIFSLASSYDFSGGQIENIARKYAVQNIIDGKTPSIDELHEICGGEVLRNGDRKQIGF